MYLTRFRLNPARRGTGRLLASPQRLHAAVMAAYPPDTEVRPLWRLDRASTHELSLYIVGSAKPDLTHLVEQAGWPTSAAWDTTTYNQFLDRILTGQAWRFRLAVNPVRIKPQARGERGKVVPVGGRLDQEQWLRDKAPTWGFTLAGAPNGLEWTGRAQDAFLRSDGTAKNTVTITRARFDGILTVTDAELFRASLTSGMGRAKAYGCGLMTLAKPK